MAEHVYKLVEIVGSSSQSQEAAIQVALKRAQQTLRNIRWFEVAGQRGYVDDQGEVMHQVTLKIGFTMDD